MIRWLRFLFTPITFNAAGGAAIAAAAITTGGSLYTANKQQEAIEDAEEEQRRLAGEAKINEQQILAENARVSKESEGASAIFGSGDPFEAAGTYDDFLAPKQGTKTNTLSGGTTSTLGFGV